MVPTREHASLSVTRSVQSEEFSRCWSAKDFWSNIISSAWMQVIQCAGPFAHVGCTIGNIHQM
jgi:hypothetical protein